MNTTKRYYAPIKRYKTLEEQMQAVYKQIKKQDNPKIATLHNNGLTDRIEGKTVYREFIALLEF